VALIKDDWAKVMQTPLLSEQSASVLLAEMISRKQFAR